MANIDRPKIEIVESSSDGVYGKFSILPLGRGFGNTLGNGLRRVLLSSLPGVAPCAVKINGVMHEFSTIEGVKEDVVEIILNIKNLIINLENCEFKTITLDARGPAKITAGMIEHDSDVTIINPDSYIATLEDGMHFHMEIIVSRGVGYLSAEQNRAAIPDLGLGAIAVDSIFTPVLKSNYSIENSRVGQVTDYDKLTLEVLTNGTVTAKQAVSIAAIELIEQFGIFADLCNPEEIARISVPKTKTCLSGCVEKTLEELEFSVRAFNSLKRAGIKTLSDLASMSREELYRVRNLGKKSFDEVVEKLSFFGFNFSGNEICRSTIEEFSDNEE
jgi:DNA-directed RNA polymerase subunit alpha